jgi:hypothetical protein
LTERRQQIARWRLPLAVASALASLAFASAAWAQGAVRDSSGTLTASPEDEAKKTWLERKFGGSTAEVSTYVGTGTFYTSGYHDPYVSNALFARPQYNIGTKYKLAVAARIYFEEEYTTPDTPNARRWSLQDSVLYLNAKNLYTMPRAKVTFGVSTRVAIPLSFESRYSHMVTALGINPSATWNHEFGRADAQGKRWNFMLMYAQGFSKPFYTSATRGLFPGDTTNCRTTVAAGAPGGLASAQDDRCGGPLNTEFAISETGVATLSRGRFSFTASLGIFNSFKYSVDSDTYKMIIAAQQTMPLGTANTTAQGRTDMTWGILGAGYDITDKLNFELGIATIQPAMTLDNKSLRFPFFDFYGTNAMNYSQVFVGVSGTL